MNQAFYQTPAPSSVMKLLWKAAGGDRYILERATYSDQMKYMCLGGIIISTGILAGLSGGYAFYTIFENKTSAIVETFDLIASILSIVFGFIWGLIIFNIDRFIVTSTGKGDGTEAITWEELKGAVPRIIMGIIIALTISQPIEIRMFKTEINARLYTIKQKFQDSLANNDRNNVANRRLDLDNEDEEIQSQQKNYLRLIGLKDSLFNVETSSGQAGRIKGLGSVALALRNERDKLKEELRQYKIDNKDKINEIETKRKKIEETFESQLNNNTNVANSLDGLLERIKLAHEIAGWAISLFITLLFVTIELTPIFFKMMLVKSPYDYLEENIKELIRAQNGIHVDPDHFKDRKGLDRYLVEHYNSKLIYDEQAKIREIQITLSNYARDKYLEEQKKQIDADPLLFVKNPFRVMEIEKLVTSFQATNTFNSAPKETFRPIYKPVLQKEKERITITQDTIEMTKEDIAISSYKKYQDFFINKLKEAMNYASKVTSEYAKKVIEIIIVTVLGVIVACFSDENKISYGGFSSILTYMFYLIIDQCSKILSFKKQAIS